jgi:hypothetical protein
MISGTVVVRARDEQRWGAMGGMGMGNPCESRACVFSIAHNCFLYGGLINRGPVVEMRDGLLQSRATRHNWTAQAHNSMTRTGVSATS